MSLLSLIFGAKPKTANLAKERLQLIIARERVDDGKASADFLPAMQQELVAVISKYVHINADDIKVSMEKKGNYEVLEVNIVLPEQN
ncbi:MAG: cell division topological specificity factor MinE [Fluviibacter sp.]|jgi:cell division topological specificity factor